MASSFSKLMGKSTDLQMVLDKQKILQECMVKMNPCRVNVSSALLKWSMAESNLSLFDAFSSWSDLDYALIQLDQTAIDQNFAFRQTFKNIQGEERRLTELQKVTEAASKKVKQICSRLESARKSKKLDQVKVDHFEAELTLAKGKEREMLSILDAKEKEFENCKGQWVKEILCIISKCYVDCLEQSLNVWKVKHHIATTMAAEPVYQREQLKTDTQLKVSGMFAQLDFELPHREETTNMKKRTLPAKPPEPTAAEDSYEWKVDGTSGASDADDDNYACPDISRDYGDQYLVPGIANDNHLHPAPPTLQPEDTASSEGSDVSSTKEDKIVTPGRGVKVLPSAGKLNPLKSRRIAPPSLPPKGELIVHDERYYNMFEDKLPKPTPREPDKSMIHKKPVLLPKPVKRLSNSKLTNYLTITDGTELFNNIDADEHEYSDVPIEFDTNISRTTHNSNIKQVVETDSDAEEDYEHVGNGGVIFS